MLIERKLATVAGLPVPFRSELSALTKREPQCVIFGPPPRSAEKCRQGITGLLKLISDEGKGKLRQHKREADAERKKANPAMRAEPMHL
jgi:hypothetical protein